MPKIIVDGISYEVDASNNLLEALLALKRDLPYFCWHPSLGSIGACRQCAVVQYRDEDDKTGRIVMACMTPVTEGAIFSTDTENAKQFRREVIEKLMINHPHDCPVCEEGGECHLQDMTVMTGHRMRQYRGLKTTHRNQDLGPFINHEMNRCITCYRCVRYYRDYAGGHDLAPFASRGNTYFGRFEDGPLENEFSGNLVEVCPTGVFTDRTLSEHYTRKWDLQSAPSICAGCAIGCNTSASERYGQFRRIANRFNQEVNGYFLCDRGRFGGGFVSGEQRVPHPGLRNAEGKYDAVSEDKALDHATRLIVGAERVVAIGSPRASLESNYLLRELVGKENFWSGVSVNEQELAARAAEILREGNVRTLSLAEAEKADAVLVLGEDTTNTSPRLALALRQSVRNRAKELAAEAQIPQWNDAAVRKLAQHDTSPLILVTTYEDRLDEVATLARRATPEQIARIGFAIANRIDPGYAGVDGLSDEERKFVERTAELLRGAKRPLIVSGTGAGSARVLEAAANVAWSLGANNGDTGIALCVPECNSMGLALLDRDDPRTLDVLLNGTARIDTAIVVENDLFRRAPAHAVGAWLERVDHLIVLDSVDTETASAAELVLPAATFAETHGTLVNNEGRAQRFFSVFKPAGEIQGSWKWLLQLGKCLERDAFSALEHFDDVNAACAGSDVLLAGITRSAPPADTRVAGMKIARMTHRSSGRTAMVANVMLHEPRQPADEDSVLAYTMEGMSGGGAGSMAAFSWAPGWNSNQSIHKYQTTAGGPLMHGVTGVRLIEPAGAPGLRDKYRDVPQAESAASDGTLRLLPRYHIFGSDELSALTRAIAARAPDGYIAIGPAAANALSVVSRDGVELSVGDATVQVEVVVDSSVPDGCALYPAGLPELRELAHLPTVKLRKAANWTPRTRAADHLIAKQ